MKLLTQYTPPAHDYQFQNYYQSCSRYEFFSQFAPKHFGPPTVLETRSLRWQTRHCRINPGTVKSLASTRFQKTLNIAEPDPAQFR